MPVLTGWQDQGLITDVMVHMGSFVAVLVYFWRDVIDLFWGALDLIRRKWTANARKALFKILTDGLRPRDRGCRPFHIKGHDPGRV